MPAHRRDVVRESLIPLVLRLHHLADIDNFEVRNPWQNCDLRAFTVDVKRNNATSGRRGRIGPDEDPQGVAQLPQSSEPSGVIVIASHYDCCNASAGQLSERIANNALGIS